jgi:ATPase subunit of ABC transporter with duplicated ATPase domains
VAKTQIRSQIESQNAQREKKISQLNEFIARFSAGTRSSQVQSRRKEVERLQVTELARSNIQRPYLKFEQKRPSGKHILELEGVTKSYDTSEVIRSFTASIVRGEKIALMGRNGAGKTTLLNALLANSPTIPEAELRQTSGYDGSFLTDGKVIWGHEAAVGYFAQDHKALIQPGMTAFEWLHQWEPGASNEEIRGLLGQMLFPREDGDKKTEVLSGGEAARLIFCKLMLQKPNVLVFDEPTNHLDLESINALNIALQRYQGTVLLCTHDEDLIDEVATRIWHFEENHQITDFKGAYEDYQSVSV